MRMLRLVVVAIVAAALAARCGSSENAAAPARRAAPAPSCAALVTALQRGNVPATATGLRRTIRRLTETGNTLERRYALEGTRAAVDVLAAAARTRARAAAAVRDRRPTAARRLFVTARMIDVRAQMLARGLADRCPPE